MSAPREARSFRVARIDTTHGLRGELSARLMTDFPERFEGLEHVRLGAGDEGGRRYRLLSWRPHKGKVLLRLEGVEGVGAARGLVGNDVWVDAGDVLELPADTYWHQDLIGLQVRRRSGEALGTVREVVVTGGVDLLRVDGGGRELLIPAARSICVEVDLEAGVLVIEPPEGLLEINAV